jgi:hypothetical protein
MEVAEIRSQLSDIAVDMAGKAHENSKTAEDYKKAEREWKYAKARQLVQTEGKNAEEREAKVILALYDSPEYKEFIRAEGAYEGMKAYMEATKVGASALQSLLKDAKDESYLPSPQMAGPPPERSGSWVAT